MDDFNFIVQPFNREVKIEQRFKVDFIEKEVKKLIETIENRESGVLIGSAGSGKSVALRALVSSMPETRYRIVYLKLADLVARDMCRQIALGLGLAPVGNYPSLVRTLEDRLFNGFEQQGMRQVLIFDDAHEMRYDSLRLVRLLTNFNMDSKLVVSIILSGHLSLKKILMKVELEDIKQRINTFSEIRLLSRDETKSYIKYRVNLAGVNKNLFDGSAYDALFEITQGNMRAIDKLAFASLQIANTEGLKIVSATEVAIAKGSQWM